MLMAPSLSQIRFSQSELHVIPQEPVIVEVSGSATGVEPSCGDICRFHVYTNTTRLFLQKPSCKKTEQLNRDPTATSLRDDIDPLELSLTSEPLSEMTGDQTDDRSPFGRNVEDT